MRIPWGNGDSSDPDPSTEERVTQANHSSVTEEVLTGTIQKRWIRSNRAWLHDRPLIDYLQDGEQPHFVLTSDTAIDIGIDDLTPEAPFRGFCCITDKNIHLVAGKEPENAHRRIGLSELLEFGIQPGDEDPSEPEAVSANQNQFTPTLRFRTTGKLFEFHVTEPITLDDIDQIGDYVVSQTSANSWGYSDWWVSLRKQRIEKRRKVKRERKRRRKEQLAKRKEEERLEQLRRERRQEELKRIAEVSGSESVTPTRLDPIFDSLVDGESVEFILIGGQRIIGMRNHSGEVVSQSESEQICTAVTPQRILTKTNDEIDFLQYDDLKSASITVLKNENEEEFLFLDLTTEDLTILFDASEFRRIHLQNLVSRVRELIEEADQREQ